MTHIFILVSLLALAGGVLLVLAYLRSGSSACPEFPDHRCFESLVDPAHTQVLIAAGISGPELRRLERMRIRATVAYLLALNRCAAAAIHDGVVAQRSSDPAVAARGEEVVASAIALRARAWFAIVRLYAMLPFPTASPRYASLLKALARLTTATAALGNIRNAPPHQPLEQPA